jgi:DNA (cytosine-5)-methyltransferase 1
VKQIKALETPLTRVANLQAEPPQDFAFPLVAVDVFSGAGGLTVGMKRAGFSVAVAVELDQRAMDTYAANHPDVITIQKDIRKVTGKSLLKKAGGTIHVLAGCPPCQGFSSLTNPSTKRDPRNALIDEMTRLVRSTRPLALMMENVPGLEDRGKYRFKRLLRNIKKLGYIPRFKVVQVADYGVPQKRRRLVLLAGRGFCIEIPKPTHSRTGEDGLQRWRTLRDAIGDLQTTKPVTLSRAMKNGGPQAFNWHVVRQLSADNLNRLRSTRVGASRFDLPRHLRPKCHKDVDEGYSNYYGRMRWTQVPVTMTGGCTTLSKGRFGHPRALRTISVREAARIQTFPDSYIFKTPYMDSVCDMVGNALPCDFAEFLGRHVLISLQSQLSSQKRVKEK